MIHITEYKIFQDRLFWSRLTQNNSSIYVNVFVYWWCQEHSLTYNNTVQILNGKQYYTAIRGRLFMTSVTLGRGEGSIDFWHLLTGGEGVSQSLTLCWHKLSTRQDCKRVSEVLSSNMQIMKYACMQVRMYAGKQECRYTGMQLCRYASMQL